MDGWDVVLDVWPEVFAWGVLVVPKDVAPGERRPVVVVQHGRNGLPRDTIDRHVPVLQRHRRRPRRPRLRRLRAAQPVSRRRSVPLAQSQGQHHERHAVLVHPRSARAHPRLAGLAALRGCRAHRLLRPELRWRDGRAHSRVLEKYALSICSGDFNQWTRKIAATDQPFSFMRTIEWEMPYWNWGRPSTTRRWPT